MTPSEKLIEKSFIEYRTSNTAYMMILYPKMRAAGFLGKAPAWVQVAKAPFDVAGFFMSGGMKGIFIAAEIKENKEHKTSLQIIAPDKKGTGLQYHQLEALVDVHRSGGLSRVLWDNGGEWGLLDGAKLVAAKAAFDTSLKAAKAGYPDQKRGSRSILWGNFDPIKMNGVGVPLWLPAPKPMTSDIALSILTNAFKGAVDRLAAKEEPAELTAEEESAHDAAVEAGEKNEDEA